MKEVEIYTGMAEVMMVMVMVMVKVKARTH